MDDSYSHLTKGNITKGVSVVRLTYSRLNLRGEEWYAEGPLLTVIELRLKKLAPGKLRYYSIYVQ